MDIAADGITGLPLAVANEYDAIILDSASPGMDGLDLCRRPRQDAGNWAPADSVFWPVMSFTS
jgi:DNA-binding response OmpR family regulator